MRSSSIRRLVVGCLLALALPDLAAAIVAPKPGVELPRAFLERRATQPNAFTFKRSLIPLVQKVQRNRANLQRGMMTAAAAAAAGGTAVSGTKSIPVLLAKFSNTGSDPYAVANLQKELFDGPWPTGTMTDYYREISYGAFTVTGTVFPWKTTPQDDAFYEGGTDCNGGCAAAPLGDFLKSILDANDAAVDFSKYDNDGPDGAPNSGDDDGFVDFVAFVHPESGGECGNQNIWSHRWSYDSWKPAAYTTQDAKNGGGSIKVNDYVIMPAFACDGTTMIQIGVFAHEFGHAFGLPDLYDTDPTNGKSAGLGNWCLMASGSWGGDGVSPERPTHMSAWSKEFLGWITPTELISDLVPASLPNVEEHGFAYKIPISAKQYYLVTNRQQKLFDTKLPASGLLIQRINQTVIDTGLVNNTVNADENNKGVDLEEADGLAHLDANANRGDAGDPFPGSSQAKKFDNGTNPTSAGTISICNIGNPADPMAAELRKSLGTCAGVPPTATPGGVVATLTPTRTVTPAGVVTTPTPTPTRTATPVVTASPGSDQPGGNCSTIDPTGGPPDGSATVGWALLVLPLLLGLVLLVLRRRPPFPVASR